jgi:hypothetical protein
LAANGVSEIRRHVILSVSEIRTHVKAPVSEIRTYVSCQIVGGPVSAGRSLVPLGRSMARKSPGSSIFLLRSVLSAEFSHGKSVTMLCERDIDLIGPSLSPVFPPSESE